MNQSSFIFTFKRFPEIIILKSGFETEYDYCISKHENNAVTEHYFL